VTDWDEAVAFALTLPGTELSTSYGKPALKVNKKAFLYTGREPSSFAVASPLGEKDMLMETDPGTFWETDHYRGWPAILVRYGSAERERIESVIARAWWDKAPAAVRKSFGERP
jgi:hypothetical protein